MDSPRLVQPPSFLSLQLKNENLHVIVVRREALSAGWGQIHVGSDHATEELLQGGTDHPHGLVESLRVQKSKAASGVVKVPNNCKTKKILVKKFSGGNTFTKLLNPVLKA